ncbi:type I pantothenate kinase [Paenibacillus profundus]|uniref:Pantothenate kinase n=1 Tax=Paenibacillus profundus TaxID=1173085 RepID=A0ABS8YGF9_9BACL|nr:MULTISPECIES: type I pantothenate kinase [Paenibacillus]MCE5170014.1 type I pantothenate kinase [Paenibacillus profundus]MCM3339748.1 type I pantothenate kinase [Paenibacillus sp. MER TA 81-3]
MHIFSPYITIEREDWSRLHEQSRLSLSPERFESLKGINERISVDEVEDIYLPLTKLINLHVAAAQQLRATTASFLQKKTDKVPYIIGIAGSVAAGKSTTARLLQALLSQYEEHPEVEIVTTDGFLYPNRILEDKRMMNKKGFPQSYDTKRLIQFLTDIKAGQAEVHAPVYSHLSYDIIPDETIKVKKPDILILEGINVLQVSREASVFVSDFFDFSIYVEAREPDLEKWYVERFLLLRDTAFQNPTSYFHRYAELTEEEAITRARSIWRDINQVNLTKNILPTKGRAKLILSKDTDHRIQNVHLRK